MCRERACWYINNACYGWGCWVFVDLGLWRQEQVPLLALCSTNKPVSWAELLQEDWGYQISDLKISSMTSGIFFKSKIRKLLEQYYAKKWKAYHDSVCPDELIYLECVFHELISDSEQLVYFTIRQNFVRPFPPTCKAAILLTRVILWVCLLGPIPIKCESVLGSSTGAAV